MTVEKVVDIALVIYCGFAVAGLCGFFAAVLEDYKGRWRKRKSNRKEHNDG